MKYDDSSWHYGGDFFPEDLPDEAGATHTGMFLAWAILRGLGGQLHVDESPQELRSLQQRSVTPGAFFLKCCDGKFTDEDLNKEGNRFVKKYFNLEKGQYLADYENTLGDNLPSLYHVADSWENFDRLSSILDARLATWRQGG